MNATNKYLNVQMLNRCYQWVTNVWTKKFVRKIILGLQLHIINSCVGPLTDDKLKLDEHSKQLLIGYLPVFFGVSYIWYQRTFWRIRLSSLILLTHLRNLSLGMSDCFKHSSSRHTNSMSSIFITVHNTSNHSDK